MAIYLALILIIWASGVAGRYFLGSHRPLSNALKTRNALLEEVVGHNDVDEARISFAEHYSEVDAAMMDTEDPKGQVMGLRRCWEEYRETIVDPSAVIIKNTARPENFFLHLVDEVKTLGWLANIFIAIGLGITFLGIIAALSSATASMQGAGADGMREGLQQLLGITAAKFWASVGGLAGSIILRTMDYHSKKRLGRQLSRLCDYLEHGMAYLPPQRIAQEQLDQAKEQSTALKSFSTDFALVIEDAFGKKVEPMVAVLGNISDGIERLNGDGSAGVIEAIREHAGDEMKGLAAAMGGMAATLGTLADKLEKQGESTDRQIDDAVRKLSSVSEEMRNAFAELNRNFEMISTGMQKTSDEAGSRIAARFETLVAQIEGTMGSVNADLSGMVEGLMRGEREAAEANRLALTETIGALKNATESAGENLAASAEAASVKAAEVSAAAIDESFSKFNERFAEATAPLLDGVRIAASSIERTASGFASSQESLENHARTLTSASGSSREAAEAFGRAANDVREATEPMRSSTAAIETAINASRALADGHARAAEEAREEMRELAAQLRDTSSAAERAWADYRGRFAEVDASLSNALTSLADASKDHAGHVNERVGQIDLQLGEGIARLGDALSPLREFADQADDLLRELRSADRVAAE